MVIFSKEYNQNGLESHNKSVWRQCILLL